MQWVPQKPPSHRVRLLAFTIAAIPVVFLVLLTVVAIWSLIGLALLPN
jgi:hypothetical protein